MNNIIEKMLFESGKIYKLRNGLITSELRTANNGTNYKFEAEVLEQAHTEPSVLCWLKNGRYLTNTLDNEYDITHCEAR